MPAEDRITETVNTLIVRGYEVGEETRLSLTNFRKALSKALEAPRIAPAHKRQIRTSLMKDLFRGSRKEDIETSELRKLTEEAVEDYALRELDRARRLSGMIDREMITRILEELKAVLNIKDKIRLELKPMKTKAASISLKRGAIRLSKFLAPKLNEGIVKNLILHELARLNLNTTYHRKDFYNLIYNIISKGNLKKFEKEILAKLMELNSETRRVVGGA